VLRKERFWDGGRSELICEEAEQGGEDAGGAGEAWAGVACVYLQEVGEEVGFVLEGGEGSGHEGGGAVHQEEGAGHDVGQAMELCVGALVQVEVFGAEGVCELESLTEAEGKAFAGDGVDGAGGVADEGYVAGGDATETAAHGDGSAGCVAGTGQDEAMLQGWEEMERLLKVDEFFGGDEDDADLGGGDWGDVGLGVAGPVDFDEACPGGDGEVLAEGDATRAGGGLFETRDGANSGLMAVGAYDPAGSESAFVGVDVVVVDVFDYGLPVEADAECDGAIVKKLVEHGAMKASSAVCGEGGFGCAGVAYEANALERVGCGLQELPHGGMVEVDAQLGESGECVGQEAFAAGLIDRGLPGVGYIDLETLTGCGDGAG
jgi:hypothetical protein